MSRAGSATSSGTCARCNTSPSRTYWMMASTNWGSKCKAARLRFKSACCILAPMMISITTESKAAARSTNRAAAENCFCWATTKKRVTGEVRALVRQPSSLTVKGKGLDVVHQQAPHPSVP